MRLGIVPAKQRYSNLTAAGETMEKDAKKTDIDRERAEYAAPAIMVLGKIEDLTHGGAGPLTDVALAGSQ